MEETPIVCSLAPVSRPVRIGRLLSLWGVFLGLSLLPAVAHAKDCSSLPTSFTGNEFPKGDFFSNFNNPCYTIAFTTGHGAQEYGDLNAQYYQLFFRVDPRYQLILVSPFPNARYYSVSLNDEHSALSQSILDTNIVPLTSQYVNPFQPGVSYADGQLFAVPINFGGTPGKLETGCMMNGYNVDVNGLDATRRHAGMDWNTDSNFFQQFRNRDSHILDNALHTNPNHAGVVLIRAYMDATPLSYRTNPQIIVRDVASGCAYPADYALNTLQIVTTDGNVGHPWMDQAQVTDHHAYSINYLPQWCNTPPVPPNMLPWSRMQEYVPWTNPDAAYISTEIPAGLPGTLAKAGEVLRIRVRVPATPPTPCTNGCSRSGSEQMRYMSLSFRDADGSVFATLADTAMTKDANGYATLIVGTGAPVPSWVTPANGYTFLDLTAFSDYRKLSMITMRHIIPAAGFNCGGQVVPYRWEVETPAGSLMGDYMPVADYPTSASLPRTAVPLVGPGVCDVFPNGRPGISPACGVFPEPRPSISLVVTQCRLPGCNLFVAQPNPPITILGAGLGAFPNGVPFTGTSNYLRITDTTRQWTAGYTGDTCTISLSSWEVGQIQLVANVGQNNACPLYAGDNLQLDVWNPQTMVAAHTTVTVASPQ